VSTLPFAHLHCHSHYSLLDGAGTIPALLERAKALRMTSLALTDHGNLHGAIQFYQHAKNLGINPVIGLELIANGTWRGAGVLGPEAFDAVPFLDLLNEYGSPWGMTEMTPRGA